MPVATRSKSQEHLPSIQPQQKPPAQHRQVQFHLPAIREDDAASKRNSLLAKNFQSEWDIPELHGIAIEVTSPQLQRKFPTFSAPELHIQPAAVRSIPPPNLHKKPPKPPVRSHNSNPTHVSHSKSLLLLPTEIDSAKGKNAGHEFLVNDMPYLVVCPCCSQLIIGSGLQCNKCKKAYHLKCETKISSTCPNATDVSGKPYGINGLGQQQLPSTSRANHSIFSQSLSKMNDKIVATLENANGKANGVLGNKSNSIVAAVTKGRETRDIDVMFITERILVLFFPPEGQESAYKQSIKDVSRMLKVKHGAKYKIFNLSKRRQDLVKLNANVIEFGWPEELAPPLERLCSICKEVECWLSADPTNVVVFHSKGGKSRTGVVVAAYMHYTNICASDDQALDRFAMRKFYDEHIGHIVQPSQKRYVLYFSGLLSGAIKINSNAIYLHNVLIEGLPLIDGKSCHPFIKVYEKMVPLYTSSVYSPTSDMIQIRLDNPLQLRGDILVKAYHKRSFASGREALFRCQFNTCAMQIDQNAKLILGKADLDDASDDERFAKDSRVEFFFSLSPVHIFGATTNGCAAVERSNELEEDSINQNGGTLIRSDSYSDFDTTPEDDEKPPGTTVVNSNGDSATPKVNGSANVLSYTEGPINGAPYATIQLANHVNGTNGRRVSPPKGVSPPKSLALAKDDESANSISTTHRFPSEDSPLLEQQPTVAKKLVNSATSPATFDEDLIDSSLARSQLRSSPPKDLTTRRSRSPADRQNSLDIKLSGSGDSGIESVTSNDTPVTILQPKSDRKPRSQSSSAASNGPRDIVMETSIKSNPGGGTRFSDALSPTSPKSPPKIPPKPTVRPTPVADFETYRMPLMAPTKRTLSPMSPSAQRRMSPSISMERVDVNLVGQDRYDPQSKAFSYVPAQALQDHFKAPKRQTHMLPHEYNEAAPGAYDGSTDYSQESSGSIDLLDYSSDLQDQGSYSLGSSGGSDFARQRPLHDESDYYNYQSPSSAQRQQQQQLPQISPGGSEEAEIAVIEEMPMHQATLTSYAAGSCEPRSTNSSLRGSDAGKPPPATSARPIVTIVKGEEPSISNVKFEMDDLLDPNFYLNFSSAQAEAVKQQHAKPPLPSGAYGNEPFEEDDVWMSKKRPQSAIELPAGIADAKAQDDLERFIESIDMKYASPPPTAEQQRRQDQTRPGLERRAESAMGGAAGFGFDRTNYAAAHLPPRPSSTQQFSFKSSQSQVEPVYHPQQERAKQLQHQPRLQNGGSNLNGGDSMDLDWDLIEAYKPGSKIIGSSRSVGSTPIHRGWSEDSYPFSQLQMPAASGESLASSEHSKPASVARRGRFLSSPGVEMDSDDWLATQREKLEAKKKSSDVHYQRRKIQERLLLDELRHIHGEREVARGRKESDYSVEGVGMKTSDPYGAPEELLKPKPSLEHALGQTSLDYMPPQAQELLASLEATDSSYSRYPPPVAPRPANRPLHGANRLSRQMSDSSYDRFGSVIAKPPPAAPGPGERSRTPPNVQQRCIVSPLGFAQSSTATFSNSSPAAAINAAADSSPYIVPSHAAATSYGASPKVSHTGDNIYGSYGAGNRDRPGYNSSNAGGGFENLEAILWDVQAPLKQQPSTIARQSPMPTQRFGRDVQPSPLTVQQSPKSILKKPKEDRATPSILAAQQQQYQSSTQQLSSNGPIYGGLQKQHEPVFQEAAPPKQQPYAPSPARFNESFGGDPSKRPETPAFPVSKRGETPLPYHPLLFSGENVTDGNEPRSPYLRSGGAGRYNMQQQQPQNDEQELFRSPSPTSLYYGQSRRSSITSTGDMVASVASAIKMVFSSKKKAASLDANKEPMEVVHHHPVFVKDTSKYWYKPNISREDAIALLKDKPPGAFVIRDSNSFPGAFGLALKVATPPAGVQPKSANDGTELVRHFLIEPTSKGVKLKGCNNEPVFGSLSALVYQHSITPLALPCRLTLPEFDPGLGSEHINSAAALLEQGAACNVIYIYSSDTESLTGPEAVRRTIEQAFQLLTQRQLNTVQVHFKVSSQGITITDTTRKSFFRRHYPVNTVTFCGLDPEDRRWSLVSENGYPAMKARIYGFVARKIASRTDNACHIFAEFEPEQPATAIVNFVTKVMMAPQTHMNGTMSRN